MTATGHDPDLRPATACACCGAYTGATLSTGSLLLAVSNVLVIRALEAVGKRIVRADRRRFNQLGSRRWHEAHTLWPPPASDTGMTKALDSAWEIVPVLLETHGCCGVTPRQVTELLDQYVRDLLITGTAHSFDAMRGRFTYWLGIS
jgi:hypothetical protein